MCAVGFSQPFCLCYTLFIEYEKENIKSRPCKIPWLYVFTFWCWDQFTLAQMLSIIMFWTQEFHAHEAAACSHGERLRIQKWFPQRTLKETLRADWWSPLSPRLGSTEHRGRLWPWDVRGKFKSHCQCQCRCEQLRPSIKCEMCCWCWVHLIFSDCVITLLWS